MRDVVGRLAAIGVLLIAAACGGESEVVDPTATAVPGEVRFETVTIDDTEIEFAVVTPPGWEAGSAARIVLALPPGGQDHDTTERVTSEIYVAEATERGYVVLSPVAPGALFFQGSEELIPGFLDATAERFTPEGGTYYLAGVSNGGLSAFRVAGLHPDRFRALFVFPGYPPNDDDRARLADIADIAIEMYVGVDDTGWVAPMQDALAALEAEGADVELHVVAGEGHRISTLRDGVEIFDFFDTVDS